jgi:hypothetical protein
MTDRVLLAAFFAYPLMTLKVVAAIHWQALRLWRKGVKYHKHVPQRRASVPPETTTAADLRPDPQQGTR